MNNTYTLEYNPDVLTCLANLSSDEVFTPPHIVNQMLDMLPQELFRDKNTKFLDPATKSGVFLREIAKRLLEGLKDEIPDLQERIDHIFQKQLYGIAVTEMTSLLSRRSLYCSKYPNSKYSISGFLNAEGKIRFARWEHEFIKGKCRYCGANEKEYSRNIKLETHAYGFIHEGNKEFENMKFDVIIGNPPYQLSDGGAQASAKPIYQLFIQTAIKFKPKYITMITPSRWFNGGRGLDAFRNKMLSDNRIRVIHDFPNASDCFPNVDIKGGVNFFLWSRDCPGLCEVYEHKGNEIISKSTRPLIEPRSDVFIRNNEMVSIFRKVIYKMGQMNIKGFSEIVSSLKPYGLRGDFFKNPEKYNLPKIYDTPIKGGIVIHGLDSSFKRTKRYVPEDYPIPKYDKISGYKIFFARNQGSGALGEMFSEPIFASTDEICTETFVVIGPFEDKELMYNCWEYMKTKFFRALLSIRKSDQNAAQGVYEFCPLLSFKRKWSDDDLFDFFSLEKHEIEYIENNIQNYDEQNQKNTKTYTILEVE